MEDRRLRLCQLVRTIRRERDVTQVELARRLSVPQSVISKMETGERQLDFLEVEAICRELGVSLPTFVRRWQSLADHPIE